MIRRAALERWTKVRDEVRRTGDDDATRWRLLGVLDDVIADLVALATPPEPPTVLPPLLRSEAPFRVEWTEDGTIPRIVNREGNFAVEHDIVDFLNSLATPEVTRD